MRLRLLSVLPVSVALLFSSADVRASGLPRSLTFSGLLPEHKIPLADLDSALPSDWSDYTHLVLELRASTPQRWALWAYTADGPRRIEMQLFGQNVWLRASVPLQYFKGMDQRGTDLASSINRRTDSFWMSVWGPFGDLKSVEALGFAMQYPLNTPKLEIRSIRLAKQDEGSDFLEGKPVVDEFGQWAHVDYPRKIRSREQLERELADEAKAWGTAADFGYCELGGYQSSQSAAGIPPASADSRQDAGGTQRRDPLQPTGFFRIEQIDGVWWFIDPHGHRFLSLTSNGVFPFRGRGRGQSATPTPEQTAANARTQRRLEAWGFNTNAPGKPRIAYFRVPRDPATTFLGVADVYCDDYARRIDEAAREQCAPQKDDPLLIGYFMGNEPPWAGRESEVVDMILAGPDTATKAKLAGHLAAADTPARRRRFVIDAFAKYLDLVCDAVRRHDPNHLNLGIRYGGEVPEEMLQLAKVFDVCSINVYEYEPTKHIERAHRLSGRPILIGEFHLGVPENGLGSGLVQAASQTERGVGYRYYVEQAMSLPYCVGTHWFQWRDQPVTGRMDGENYNIGFVDATDRPYPELVDAAKATHRRLPDVHAGSVPPVSRKPLASEFGAPSSPWDL